jgi:hypothetical protein
MRWWKILGLAGLAGVAATGAVTVQAERRRRAYTAEEIRARLHERVAAGAGTGEDAEAVAPAPAAGAGDGPVRGLLARLRGRR